jgi:fused signal recognition particle receptor
MNKLLLSLSSTFHLQGELTTLDLGIMVAIIILGLLAFYNFFLISNDQASVEDKKEEPATEATEIEATEIEVPASEPELKVEIEKPVEAKIEKPAGLSWEKRLFKGLAKTRGDIWGKIGNILGSRELDDALVEELEEILFSSDLSPKMVDELLEYLKSLKTDGDSKDYLQLIKEFLKSRMVSAQETVNLDLYKFEGNTSSTKVIMIVGVNGAGKTTTIGKLATKLKSQGATVVVGACDTFRAAAVEQLEVWCTRAGVEIVKAGEGADPTGVAFDAVKRAKEINADYCIIDTAGRLHTKSNLMDELAKTKKVMSKVIPEAPHETLLVVDAITGQNAMRQAEEFNKCLDLTGLIFTKCDGSSKAGSAVSIVQSLNVPIVYIGVGEDVADLDIFNLDSFLDALLGIEA